MNEHEMLNSIAIIGMSGNFPKASDLKQFWNILILGEEGISHFSTDELIKDGEDINLLNHPDYVPSKGILENPYDFDAAFFAMSPKEAIMLDPQQRIFLECCYHAIEDSGIALKDESNSMGVFGTESWSTYLLYQISQNPNFLKKYDQYQLMLGNDKDYLATRVSFKLNLSGPSVSVQTACSSSLVAVHMACQSLLNGECDAALAGGVSVSFPQKRGYLYKKEMILSKDGHCRPFDETASGTVESNGAGVVLLKRLEDAIKDNNHIYAVIRGSAMNNDGAGKVGYTAPSVMKQAAVISEALEVSGVQPSEISYIETHGTGTKLGDSIEIKALKKVFNTFDKSCPIGSLKSNFGHMNAAAGVAGLIKTTLSLANEVIPKSLITEDSKEKSDLENSPFYLNTQLREWKRSEKPRLAGISSFGIGGTNVHMILEEAPRMEESFRRSQSIEKDEEIYILPLTAKTKNSLKGNRSNLISYLKEKKGLNMEDIAYTLQNCREPFNYRQAIVCKNVSEAIEKLSNAARICDADKMNGIVFMFSGQGSQFVGMSQKIYETEPRYRKLFDLCCDKADAYLDGIKIKDIIFASEDETELASVQLKRTSITQAALFIVEYSLAALLMEFGIEPDYMLGHSIGEYVAATLAEVMSLETALKLVIYRGKLMQTMEEGCMLSVALSEEQLHQHLSNYSEIDIAAVNSIKSCVVSGKKEIINQFKTELDEQNIKSVLLHTSHAFHSYMMQPILKEFETYINKISLKAPKKKIVSCMTGTPLTNDQAVSPSYWVSHIRNTVRFLDIIKFLKEKDLSIFLEIGPGKTLTSLVKQSYMEINARSILTSLSEKQTEGICFMETLGDLWMLGAKIDWKKAARNENGRRIELPLYSFEHHSYKFNHDNNVLKAAVEKEEIKSDTFYDRAYINCPFVEPDNELESIICSIWESIFSVKPIGVEDDFFELGGNSLISIQFIEKIKEVFLVDLSIAELFGMKTVKNMADIILEKISLLSEEDAEEVVNRIDSYEFSS